MTDKQYDRIVNVCVAAALGSALLWDAHHGAYELFLGIVGAAAGFGAVWVYFWRHRRPPHSVEQTLAELIHGLRSGDVVLSKSAHVVVTNELIKQDGHTCQNCPVYNAMKVAGVPVLAVHFAVWVDLNEEYHRLPKAVQEWIWSYDNPPFTSYTLVPSEPIEFDVSWEA